MTIIGEEMSDSEWLRLLARGRAGGDIAYRLEHIANRLSSSPEAVTVMREALEKAKFGLSEMLRLADMGLEESLREPEELGNFAAYNRAKECLGTIDAALLKVTR